MTDLKQDLEYLITEKWQHRCGYGRRNVETGAVERCCLVGAVTALIGPSQRILAPTHLLSNSEAFMRVIGKLCEAAELTDDPAREYRLIAWNDAAGRTREEVLAVVRKADL